MIESYQFQFDQNSQNNQKTEQKQSIFFSPKERLVYFKAKYQAFKIELNNIILNDRYNDLDDLLSKLITNIIDFYVSLQLKVKIKFFK